MEQRIKCTTAKPMKQSKTHYLVKLALLSAVAFVLMYIEIPAPFVPPWLKIDFSDIPALLAGFGMGPLAGIIVQGIKVVLFFLFKNSGTGGIGELANLIMGMALVVPSAVIYLKTKTRKGAVAALSVGAVAMGVASFLLNYFLLIPAYAQFLMPMDVILQMCAAVNPAINSLSAISFASMLFTLAKCALESVILLLLYKKLSPLLHK